MPVDRQTLLENYLKNEVSKLLDAHDMAMADSMTEEMFREPQSYLNLPLVRIKVD